MISQAEFSSRAALCRQLAKREPANGVFWIAEAENWSRLSKEKFRGEPRVLIGSDVLGSRQAPSSARPFAERGVVELWERSSSMMRSLIYPKTWPNHRYALWTSDQSDSQGRRQCSD